MAKLLYIILALAAIILLYLFWKKSHLQKEGFGQTIGLWEPQIRRYNKCVNNCKRYHNTLFATDYSWTQYLCDRECGIEADAYRDAGVPDLTPKEFQRHADKIIMNEASEEDFCRQEIRDWCKDSICTYSKENPEICVRDCERVYGYQCNSGLSWSWRP